MFGYTTFCSISKPPSGYLTKWVQAVNDMQGDYTLLQRGHPQCGSRPTSPFEGLSHLHKHGSRIQRNIVLENFILNFIYFFFSAVGCIFAEFRALSSARFQPWQFAFEFFLKRRYLFRKMLNKNITIKVIVFDTGLIIFQICVI